MSNTSTFENYIFVKYVFHMHQLLKIIYLSTTITHITSLNTLTYLRYMSTKTTQYYASHDPWSGTLNMIITYILYVSTYTCHNRLHRLYVTHYNYKWHIQFRTTYHVMMTRYISCLQVTHYERKTCYKTLYVLVLLFITSQ